MNRSFQELLCIVKYFINQKLYVFLLLLTCVLAFGFTITHFSIGIDDTSFSLYFLQGGLLAQGRFGSYLLYNVLGLSAFLPFWTDCLAVCALFGSAIVWCVLMKRIAGRNLPISAYIVFSTIFVSYPLIAEIFIYQTASLSICLGYGLIAISLIFAYEYIFHHQKLYFAIISILFVTFAISTYESFAAVYLCGVSIILILSFLLDRIAKDSIAINKHLVKFIFILLIAIVLKVAISSLIVFFIPIKNYAANSILWFHNDSLFFLLKILIITVLFGYFFASISSASIFIFLLTNLLFIYLTIKLSVRYKSISFFLLFLLLGFSNFLLSFIQGSVTPYRASQPLALFIAFIFMLLLHFIKTDKPKKLVIYFLVFFLVLIQTRELNKLFYLDFLRFQDDKNIVLQVSNTIQSNFDNNKPVIFVGNPRPRKNQDNIVGFYSKIGESVFLWIQNSPSEYKLELYRFFKMLGFSFQEPTKNQILEGSFLAKKMSVWPYKESIKEFDDFIVVNFGNNDSFFDILMKLSNQNHRENR